ncbi:MAG TPA: carboxypeptidase-like regulatory domain-containing protein [Verrucomicrobiae bacterium]|nr:carboxypeptidase-like regulatory domain-containing protein [Verrucomicrobiae bacterium]
MNLRVSASAFGIIAALAACGGGGGSSAPPPTSTATPTLMPTQTASTTNASGTLVDDDNGAPIAGVAVKLMPWSPCGPTPAPATSITPENDGCPTPLPSPQVTTGANGAFTLNGVPNGHYLLIIGADAVATVPPGYTTPPGNCSPNPCASPSPVPGTAMQATVHDNVTLTGGNQTLVAPTLPTVPAGYTAPAWETNGDYRLATLNASTEMPCLIAWQYERAQNSLAGSSVDEWLIENVRAINAYAAVAPPGSLSTPLTTGNDASTGGATCATQISSSFAVGASVYATDPRTAWFAGQYVPYNGGSTSAQGGAEFPIDPRSYTDPNHPTWP